MGLRPYFNLSISQEGASAGLDPEDTSETQQLVIYPFRASGLPQGKNYAVRVSANGVNATTSLQMSTGVIEYFANVEGFQFGTISQQQFLQSTITVDILEDSANSTPVATGTAHCTQFVNGVCSPSPVIASMKVDGQDVSVEMSIVWQANPLNIIKSKIKSVTTLFPSVSITSASLVQQLSDPKTLASAELVLNRNGRSYTARLEPRGNSTNVLTSTQVYELGPTFQTTWSSQGSTTSNSK
jgi:hypothetical protein